MDLILGLGLRMKIGSLGLPELALESSRQHKESRYLHSLYIYIVKVCRGYDGSGSARVLAQPLACRA